MSGPVAAADVQALERFYRESETEARILVSPFADASLFEQLGEHGFRLVDLDTVLYRRLDRPEHTPAPPPGIALHRAALDEAAAWVRASLTGFTPIGELPPPLGNAPIFETMFHDPAFTFLTATADGVEAGTAALHVHESTAHFFADSTLPDHRCRGVQGALIAARLALAHDAGCDLAFAVTRTGGPSQRSYERAGFAVAYSEALMVKTF
jgi:GNAT superfamily N-acetyltransferase